jgi:hypothetical protein
LLGKDDISSSSFSSFSAALPFDDAVVDDAVVDNAVVDDAVVDDAVVVDAVVVDAVVDAVVVPGTSMVVMVVVVHSRM